MSGNGGSVSCSRIPEGVSRVEAKGHGALWWTRIREARNDLVHEKAIEPHSGVDGTTFHTAQREAEIGVSFVRSIAGLLLAPLTDRSGGRPSAAADL